MPVIPATSSSLDGVGPAALARSCASMSQARELPVFADLGLGRRRVDHLDPHSTCCRASPDYSRPSDGISCAREGVRKPSEGGPVLGAREAYPVAPVASRGPRSGLAFGATSREMACRGLIRRVSMA